MKLLACSELPNFVQPPSSITFLSEINPDLWYRLEKMSEKSDFEALAKELHDYALTEKFDTIFLPTKEPIFVFLFAEIRCAEHIEHNWGNEFKLKVLFPRHPMSIY